MKQLLTILLFAHSLLFWNQDAVAADSLFVDFQGDTINVCMNEPYTLLPTYGGGTAPYNFTWSNGDTGAQTDILPTQVYTFVEVEIVDDLGERAKDTVILRAFPECVFPGDGDGDRLANNLDILALGQSFGYSGAMRPDPHLNWIGQPAPAWAQHLTSGVDFVHSDTDGSGTVDADDIGAIEINYSGPQTQPGLSGVSNGVPMYMEILSTNNQPGDTLEAAIILGTVDQPVDSVYGVAFSVNYSSIFLDAEKLWVEYDDSWLGTKGTDMITVDKNFSSIGQVDIGISRTDQVQVNGFGRIAKIIVVIDDLSGKNEGETTIDFSISHVSALISNSNVLDVETTGTSVGIILGNSQEFENLGVKLYPNPSKGDFVIEWDDPSKQLEDLTLYDMVGRNISIYSKNHGNEVQIRRNPQVSPGIYILKAKFDGASIHKRILIN
ncbi:MAG: T9SS type A sorting domain-containing protein [Bacteroidota bacterium]